MFKSAPAKIKAAGTEDGLAEGQFRALVSVFNTKDVVGDVVLPGAFTDTLADWEKSGDSIPVYWSHQMHDPDFNVGWVLEASETPDGLEVLAQLDLEEGASPKAKQVYRLLKGRRVTQFSFAYDVLAGRPGEFEGEEANLLETLKLYEVGPTPIGANQETELLGVKALGLKRGRALSTKNEQALRTAVKAIADGAAAIESVLAAVATADPEGSADDDASKANQHPGKATGSGPATAPTSGMRSRDKEPSRTPPVVSRALDLTVQALERA